VLFLLLPPIPAALALTAHLVTGNPLDDHAPGDDLRIGTADDPDHRPSERRRLEQLWADTHGAAWFALLNGSARAVRRSITSLFVDGSLQFEPDWNASILSDIVIEITGCTGTRISIR
jgi:hypothetical protein